MVSKGAIYMGVFIGSTIGSWLGSLLDHGNWFGAWSILVGAAGGIIGVWAAYKLSV